jgi:hypothetical protein
MDGLGYWHPQLCSACDDVFSSTEVGKMTIDYLLPLSKPSTRQVADIVYLKKIVGSQG